MACTVAKGKTTDSLFTKKRSDIQYLLNAVFERDPANGNILRELQAKNLLFKHPIEMGRHLAEV